MSTPEISPTPLTDQDQSGVGAPEPGIVTSAQNEGSVDMRYSYTRIFSPPEPDDSTSKSSLDSSGAVARGDRTDGREYRYSEEIILAVNVAIVTGRPLLVSGSPGSGKSSLARSVASWQNWRLYSKVITSSTTARDLKFRYDSLLRLNDAQRSRTDPIARRRLTNGYAYAEPGVLWWAFDRVSAERRGAPAKEEPVFPAADPATAPDGDPLPVPSFSSPPAVVLLDEIDKADPDVPNDLLVPLGSLQFEVEELGIPVALVDGTAPPLVIITTNGERDLPNAFRRRCLVLNLPDPTVSWLVDVAKRHFGTKDTSKYQPIAERTAEAARDARKNDQAPPGTAEFLDAVRACRTLEAEPVESSVVWQAIRRATLLKWQSTGRVS